MGKEINKREFNEDDFDLFSQQLKIETEILRSWFREDKFSRSGFVAGLELEAWLIDKNFQPAPINEEFFRATKSEYLSPELAKFNIELNVDPLPLKSDVLTGFEQSIRHHWHKCRLIAQELDAELLATGILPTLKDTDLTVDNMSKMARYEALNEQVLNKRKGKPLNLHIVGKTSLQSVHYDVMLEAAATSIQVHIQVPEDKAVAYYNSSVFVSALTVAASANSPFLFGKNLWEESRIPLFEQAVESGGFDAAADGPLHRVSFGSGYCRQSLMECFDENIKHFPVLLPMCFDEEAEQLEHLRLHNGTIWRWNRPIIGFDEAGQQHLRIEHRVMAAGPTVLDQIANVALYYGLVHYFAVHHKICEEVSEFSTAKDNFYQAARNGLNAKIKWLDGESYQMQQLFSEQLLDNSRQGLHELGILESDIDYFINVIEQRVKTGKTGSHWQQAFVKRHGDDMQLLARQYFINQNAGKPVHEWDLEITDVE